MLAAVFDPLHRPIEHDRRNGDSGLLGIKHQLGPESAADVGGRNTDRGFLASQNLRKQTCANQRRLCRTPERELALNVGIGDRAATFDRMRATAMLNKGGLEDVRGTRERGINIAVSA